MTSTQVFNKNCEQFRDAKEGAFSGYLENSRKFPKKSRGSNLLRRPSQETRNNENLEVWSGYRSSQSSNYTPLPPYEDDTIQSINSPELFTPRNSVYENASPLYNDQQGNGNNDELFAFATMCMHIATMCFSHYTSDYVILPNCWQKPCALWL